MIVGFTGTREGMSESQKRVLLALLCDLKPKEFHHGGAIGADLEAHKMAIELGIDVVIHPAYSVDQQAKCYGAKVQHPPAPPLQRNRYIVACSDMVIAAPRTDKEELRSGTWATIRYAREAGLELVILPREA